MASPYNNDKPQTICYNCKTPSPTCPWKYNFTPVPGWDAEPTVVKMNSHQSFDSYHVKACPLFEENKRVIAKEKIPEIPDLRKKINRYRSKNRKRMDKC